jgi:hypothetical protein
MFDPSVLSAAIPGMSLTTEPGNRPWENPPAIATVEEAIEYYSERLLDPENVEMVLDPLVQGVSIESVVDVITTSSVMNGIHSLDVGFIISPVISEMIRYVADAHDVKYEESYTRGVKDRAIPLHKARKIVQEVAEEQEKTSGFRADPKEFMRAEMTSMQGRNNMPVEEPQAPPSRGLMARPSASNTMGA